MIPHEPELEALRVRYKSVGRSAAHIESDHRRGVYRFWLSSDGNQWGGVWVYKDGSRLLSNGEPDTDPKNDPPDVFEYSLTGVVEVRPDDGFLDIVKRYNKLGTGLKMGLAHTSDPETMEVHFAGSGMLSSDAVLEHEAIVLELKDYVIKPSTLKKVFDGLHIFLVIKKSKTRRGGRRRRNRPRKR